MPVIEELKKMQKQIDRTEAWEQRGQFKGIRTWRAADQVIPAATYTRILQQRTVYDFGAPFMDGMHQTSTALFTGTVSTVIAGTTLTGVGTLFTTEINVGSIVIVNAAEYNVVTAIASDTSATVNFPWQLATAGVQMRRVVDAFVIPGRGVYSFGLNAELTVTGYLGWVKNELLVPIAYPATTWEVRSGLGLAPTAYGTDLFNKFDLLMPVVFINAGGTVVSREPNSPACFISRIS